MRQLSGNFAAGGSGSAATKSNNHAAARFQRATYPRGLLEEAWAQIVDELGTEIEDYKAKPYRKVPPSPELIEKRENAEAKRRIASRLAGHKVYVASEAEINRWVKE